MRLLATAVLLTASALFTTAAAQELVIPKAVYPALPKKAASAEGFVPAGWALESQATGDLNGDGVPDLVLVLRGKDPRNVVAHEGLGENPLDTNPRILAVAFGAASGGYALALENRTLIPRRTDPVLDDPLSETGGVAIEGGALKVRLHLFASAGGWGMSTTTYAFRHREGRFALIGFDRDETQRNSGETRSVSINYATGKMKIATGNIEKDAQKVRWKTLPRRPPPTIDQIGDGLEFDPER